MLPDYFVSSRHWAALNTVPVDAHAPERDHSDGESLPAEKAVQAQLRQRQQLEDYENLILSGRCWAGQSCNTLLEERDRHVKARIFCAAKIETFSQVMDVLVGQGLVTREELCQLLETSREFVMARGEDVWLNLLTGRKAGALFYQLEDRPL